MSLINVPGPWNKEKRFIRVGVANVGSRDTKVMTLGIAHYKTLWRQLLGKSEMHGVIMDPTISGSPGLPVMLPPGDEWSGFLDQHEDIVSMATNGRLYAEVYHSMHKKPVRARITVREDSEAEISEEPASPGT